MKHGSEEIFVIAPDESCFERPPELELMKLLALVFLRRTG